MEKYIFLQKQQKSLPHIQLLSQMRLSFSFLFDIYAESYRKSIINNRHESIIVAFALSDKSYFRKTSESMTKNNQFHDRK